MALYMTDENGKLVKIAGNILTISTESGSGIQTLLDTKVDKIEGLGLSSNDYTDTDKEKVLSVESGANKTIIDSSLSTSSANPVRNSVVTEKLNELSSQISKHKTEYNALKAVVDEMLLKVYPVNSIYLSLTNTDPKNLFGGTWQLLSEGYALWTTTTSGQGGKTIAAGLPNITGQVQAPAETYAGTQSGALYRTGSATVDGHGYTVSGIGFDASKSNSIYGKSTTVQPPAIKVFAWKRTS